MAALTRIPTPDEIATHPAYTDGDWRDPATGRDLITFLTDTLGPAEAQRRLNEADQIRQGWTGYRPPLRRPVAADDFGVWIDPDGIYHDPIHMRQVTVCGIWIPLPCVYDRAAGRACPDCFTEEAS